MTIRKIKKLNLVYYFCNKEKKGSEKMKKVDVEAQRQINGGWCLRANFKCAGFDHYINGWYQHHDKYRYKSGSWYYYY